MNILDHIIELQAKYDGKVPIYKQRPTGEEWTRTDVNVKICTNCEKAWEVITWEGGRIQYYLDYPTIGKERKTCPRCKR